MEKVVIDNVLDAIHYILKHNEFKFTDRQLDKADQFIIPFIKELDISEKEFNVKVHGAPKLAHDKRVMPLLIKYFAFIEDNISLYNELLEDGYLFMKGYNIKFYALDKTLSKNFKKNEYKNLLFKNEHAISSFYYSIRSLDHDDKESICKDFSDIIHIDHSTLNVGDKDDLFENYNFLIKRNILSFGKDFLLSLNKTQRKIINSLHFSFDEEIVSKIKELFTKYPDYNNSFPLTSDIFHLFSVDEIYSMSSKDYILYDCAIRNNLLDRVREILNIDPLFNCPKTFIREEIFKVLTNDEIVELTNEAKEKISKIKIPSVDGVLIMPFNKINRIVLLDKAAKKLKNHTK